MSNELVNIVLAKHEELIKKNEQLQQALMNMIDLHKKATELYETTISEMKAILKETQNTLIEIKRIDPEDKQLNQTDDADVIKLIYSRYLVYSYDHNTNRLILEFECKSGFKESQMLNGFYSKWPDISKTSSYDEALSFYSGIINADKSKTDTKMYHWYLSPDSFIKIILPHLNTEQKREMYKTINDICINYTTNNPNKQIDPYKIINLLENLSKE